MAKKTSIAVAFILIFSQVAYAQIAKLKSGKKIIDLVKYEIDTLHKIYPMYKDTNEAILKSPEDMLVSNLSANSQEWVNYNTYQGAKRAKIIDSDYLESQKNIKINNASIVSKSKISLKLDSFNIIVYKYYFVNPLNQNRLSAVLTMIKKNNRYYITTFPELMDLSFVLLSLNDDILKKVFLKQKVDNQLLTSNIYTKNGIDLNKLKSNFSELLEKTESNEREYLFDKNSIFY